VRVDPATASFVVVSQSRRLSAGQDTIPTPHRRNTPDGLLALHFVPRTASPLRTGTPWRPWFTVQGFKVIRLSDVSADSTNREPLNHAPDGLLALHFVPRTASPLRTGAPWRPWWGIFSLRIFPHRSEKKPLARTGAERHSGYCPRSPQPATEDQLEDLLVVRDVVRLDAAPHLLGDFFEIF